MARAGISGRGHNVNSGTAVGEGRPGLCPWSGPVGGQNVPGGHVGSPTRELNHVLVVEGLNREPEAVGFDPGGHLQRTFFQIRSCSEGLSGHEFGRQYSARSSSFLTLSSIAGRRAMF